MNLARAYAPDTVSVTVSVTVYTCSVPSPELMIGITAALLLALVASAWSRSRLKRRSEELLAAKDRHIAEQHARIEKLERILDGRSQRADSSSLTDALTGCYTETAILDSLHKAISLSRRHGYPLSCVLFHVDRRTEIGEQQDLLTGDAVLSSVAACIREHIRQDDSLGLHGDGEFLLLLPHTRLRGARVVAEKICAHVAGLDLEACGLPDGVTISGGIAEVLDGGALSTEEMMRQAHTALQHARQKGRCGAEAYSPES